MVQVINRVIAIENTVVTAENAVFCLILEVSHYLLSLEPIDLIILLVGGLEKLYV